MAEPALDSRLSCDLHPEHAAVALCVDCEGRLCNDCRRVGHDGLSRCPSCLEQSRLPSRIEDVPAPEAADESIPRIVPERVIEDPAPHALPPPEPARPTFGGMPFDPRDALEPIPWEQPERYPSAVAMWLTLVAILKNPLLAVARIPWVRQDFVTPLVLCVTAGIVGHVGILLSAFLLADVDAILGPRFAEFGVSPTAGALLSLTTVPLGIALRVYLTSGVAHFILNAAGAAKRPYEATFRIHAYAGTCSLLAVLPGIGAPISMAMTLLVVLLGIRIAHRASPGQSFLGAAPHFLGVLLDSGV